MRTGSVADGTSSFGSVAHLRLRHEVISKDFNYELLIVVNNRQRLVRFEDGKAIKLQMTFRVGVR